MDEADGASIVVQPAGRNRLLIVAIFVGVIAVIGLLVPLPSHSRAINRTADFVHLPLFALLTYLAIRLSDRYVSASWFTRLLTTLGIVFASACAELIQSRLGRTASIHDLIANATGASSAFLFAISKPWHWSLKCVIQIAAVAACLFIMSGPARSLLDIWQIYRSGDQLATFQSRVELERWYIRSAFVKTIRSPFTQFSASFPRAMNAKLVPGELPTVQLQQLNRNWTGYASLQFDIARPPRDHNDVVPPRPLTMQLRIADEAGDFSDCQTFVTTYELLPGDCRRITIPITEIKDQPACRPLNLEQIRFLEFMALELDHPAMLQLGNIRLTRH